MKLRSMAAFAAVALIASGVAAIGNGLFPGFPIVGGASYCAGQVTAGPPGTAAICNQTVPAGPTALTGNETVVADTQLSSGQNPQTVSIPVGVLNAGPTQYSTPLTGVTTTIAAGTRQVVINPAGTIAAHTLQFPAAASIKEGQRYGFCSTQVVTALTITPGTGLTINGSPTATIVPATTGAASCFEWVYVASVTTLFRVQ